MFPSSTQNLHSQEHCVSKSENSSSSRNGSPSPKCCSSIFVHSEEEVEHTDQLVNSLVELLDKQELTDITLRVNEKTYQAHRLILSARSDVFRTMLLSGNWQECDKKEIILEEDSVGCQDVFGEFLRYFYKGTMKLTINNAAAFYALANKYNIPELLSDTDLFIQHHIHAGVQPPTVISWWHLSQLHDNAVMVDNCEHFIFANFEAIATSESFLTLDKSNAIHILSSSKLVVSDELVVYKAAEKWLMSRPSKSEILSELPEVMDCVRFHMIRPAHLGLVENSQLYSQFRDAIEKRILMAYRFQCMARDDRSPSFLDPYQPLGSFRLYTGCEYTQNIPMGHNYQQCKKFTTTSSASYADRERMVWNLRAKKSTNTAPFSQTRHTEPIYVNGQPWFLCRDVGSGRPMVQNFSPATVTDKLLLVADKEAVGVDVKVLTQHVKTDNLVFRRVHDLEVTSSDREVEVTLPEVLVQSMKGPATDKVADRTADTDILYSLIIIPKLM